MKKVNHISRNELNQFSENDLEFIYEQEKLKDFIGMPFSVENIEKQIILKKKSYRSENRDSLVKALQMQYQTVRNNEKALNEIERLHESNTFTVTTGHQLCLLGGPMYFFLKVIHVIKLTEVLNKKYPQYHFIPLFWMASEDHDSDEIDHLNLFNKTIKWKHHQKGAVGRFSLDGLQHVFDELLSLFNESHRQELDRVFSSFNGDTYGEAFRNWLNELFSEKGLIIVDGDNKDLKSLFGPIMKSELTEGFSNEFIQKTNENLKAIGRKIQVHSREINLFHLTKDGRSRITKAEHQFKIDQQEYKEEDLLIQLEKHPNEFSPNAVLRPLYQEYILPNVCYVGGMAEMNYWAQLKSVFEKREIPYPLLQFRSNVLWVDKGSQKKIESLGIEVKDFFGDIQKIIKDFIKNQDSNPLNENEIEQGLMNLEKSLMKAVTNQKNLHSWIGSELKKIEKSVSQIKSRILKDKKKSHEDDLMKIQKIKETLFPGNQLQERHQNLLHFCNRNSYHSILKQLYMAIDPLNNGFTIISEENESK